MLRNYAGLIAFTLAYMLAATARALAISNQEFLLYLVQMIVVIALVAMAHRHVGFTRGVLWGLSIWGFVHVAGGLVPAAESWPVAEGAGSHPVLYSVWIIPPHYLKYDNAVHAFGFFMATLACWQGLRHFLSPNARPGFAFAILLSFMGMGLGAINEIIEFAATKLFPSTGVGSYDNNAIDLIFNAIGALIAAGVVWIRHAEQFPEANGQTKNARQSSAGAH